MNVDRFIDMRKPRWTELARLLDRLEQTSDRNTSHNDVRRVIELYRVTSSDLNRLRSWTADPRILGRLNTLVGRAYALLYRGARGRRWLDRARELVLREIPAAFRRERAYVLLALAAMLAGMITGAVAMIADESNGPRLIPPMFFTESPRERVAAIESEEERIASVSDAAVFGAQLYTHNMRVSFLAFALAATTLIGGLWLVYFNGVLLGAVATTYFLDGVQLFFFAWVGPHGALELPAILFGTAAGLRVGRAFLLPGNETRPAALRKAFSSAWRMLAATMMLLVLAGLIEGGFSQFSAKTIPYSLKIGFAVVLFASMIVYLFLRDVGEPAD